MFFGDKKSCYAKHLDALAQYPVWTIDQIKEFLHLDFDTVQKFVDVRWLYKFNVGRCTFYSCNNKKFTNQAIIKSIMMIDANYYFLDYSRYAEWLSYGSTLENKSLIARGVRHFGYMGSPYDINLYQIYVAQHLTQKEYPKLAQMLISIHDESNSERIHVYIITRDGNIEEFEEYLDDYSQLVGYRMSGYIKYQIGRVSRPCFDYLKL